MLSFGRLLAGLRRRRSRFHSAKSAILAAWFAVLFITMVPKAEAVVRITDDHGGNIGVYWDRFTALRDANEQIIIDGTCSSACTLVLGIVPWDRICVTRNALLGFHAAWRPFLGFKVINDPATRTLMNVYPTAIRQWIARNGGLGYETMYLSGPALLAMYRECR